MKFLLPFIFSVSCAATVFGQSNSDSTSTSFFIAVETQPQFSGGYANFSKYISNNLKYPGVAQILGIDGKLQMQFIVERDGSIAEVKALNCIGAGCEAEAERILLKSPKWIPGIQNGKPVRVQYTIPIAFYHRKAMVTMKELRKSDYGFFFLIKDKEYNIDQAEELLGKEFLSNSIIIAEEQYDEQHKVAGKKATYLLKIDS
ncbi:energy transducer TonB [Mucilaginibacter roseus]|uniref:Energy transducer TonB n=1 Tax=Mucilaginibacter roseus TaxID=1528868 RepID=A0ABS8U5U6_9SPHI|nr:energy transducer TonB [Mucilaginibacter roseus]MCD8741197.1 energy transducer TonB [Mucilaginibacter roseus]